tara:strand:- start:64125 stop:64457 length:333 start_codon:yes stop_codon:yes gene_type:complete
MRKFKLLALTLVIGTASLYAVNVDEVDNSTKEIRSQIIELLKAPNFTVGEEMNVVLTFTFSSEGELVVLCAGCKDQEVINYIRENLNYKKFEHPGMRDIIYKMPLKLKAV